MKKINKLTIAAGLLAAVGAGCVTTYTKPTEPTPPPVYCHIEHMELIPENKTGFGASTLNGGWSAHICYSVNIRYTQAPGVYQLEYAVPYTNLPFGAYELPNNVPGTLLDWPMTNTTPDTVNITLPVPPSPVGFFRLRRLQEF